MPSGEWWAGTVVLVLKGPGALGERLAALSTPGLAENALVYSVLSLFADDVCGLLESAERGGDRRVSVGVLCSQISGSSELIMCWVVHPNCGDHAIP